MQHPQVARCYSVNMAQTPEERRVKYAYAKARGMDSYTASRLRDFQWPNIKYVIEYWKESRKIVKEGKNMNERQLRRARRVLTRDWLRRFGKGVYISVSHRLYSDNGRWYLHQDDNPNNPNGVCLYKS